MKSFTKQEQHRKTCRHYMLNIRCQLTHYRNEIAPTAPSDIGLGLLFVLIFQCKMLNNSLKSARRRKCSGLASLLSGSVDDSNDASLPENENSKEHRKKTRNKDLDKMSSFIKSTVDANENEKPSLRSRLYQTSNSLPPVEVHVNRAFSDSLCDGGENRSRSSTVNDDVFLSDIAENNNSNRTETDGKLCSERRVEVSLKYESRGVSKSPSRAQKSIFNFFQNADNEEREKKCSDTSLCSVSHILSSIVSTNGARIVKDVADGYSEKVDKIFFEKYEFPIVNLVFEGGGNKGMSYVGAIEVSFSSLNSCLFDVF